MYRVESVLNSFAVLASHVLHEYLNKSLECTHINSRELSELDAWIMKQLPISCHLSSESALVLVANNRLWDAETVVRSVLEGTIKFLYMGIGDSEEREKKISEFWEDLPYLNSIKWQKKASDLLSVVSNPEADEWGFIRELAEFDIGADKIKESFTKKQRKELEQKWSFTEMLKVLSAQSELKGLIGLVHGYSIGSHIIHQDADAINLIIDRNRREAPRREAMELAHGGREITDVLAFASMRYIYIQKIYLGKVEEYITPAHEELSQELAELQKDFRESEMNSREI